MHSSKVIANVEIETADYFLVNGESNYTITFVYPTIEDLHRNLINDISNIPYTSLDIVGSEQTLEKFKGFIVSDFFKDQVKLIGLLQPGYEQDGIVSRAVVGDSSWVDVIVDFE